MVIPVIDFSKLDGEEREKTLGQIANGCQEWGFFQLVNHGISVELLERVKRVCSEWYKLEREEGFNKYSTPVKLLNDHLNMMNSNNSVESPVESIVDWEDVITIQSDDAEWSFGNTEFKETMIEYRRELKKLAKKMLEIMDENLGLPKGYIMKVFNNDINIDQDDEESSSLLEVEEEEDAAFFGTKVSHYPPCPRPDLIKGLRAHTDAGGVILLYQDDEVGGLQVLKDEQWIDVQPLKNAIVINTGDQIEVLSNGKYKSAWHRVLATSDENRRSIASFYNPSLKATIAPAPQLLVHDHVENNFHVSSATAASAYPKFVFADYMSVYAKQKFQPKEPRFHAAAGGSGAIV